GLWGYSQPDIADRVAEAYENLLLFGEHTWGGSGALSHYGKAFHQLDPASYADLEASWEDKIGYIRKAATITRALSDDNLRTLAGAVLHEGPACLVYNPLPWSRSGMVEINGRSFLAENVPPCGYRTYPVDLPDEWKSPDAFTILENKFFRITCDPDRCAISSLVDKRTGREWADPAAAHGLGQYLNERFTF
ncbi:MAG: hypothetical protein HQL31_14330, partial [Planctomycetes bacterium]|nr:hypothetical protein [Planctomycetota bacterium]